MTDDMTVPQPVTSEFPGAVLRVARSDGLLRFSRIRPDDAALPAAGNRFDVPGGGVLYAGTTPESCFAETLARFRPKRALANLLDGEPSFMAPGGIPQDWRLRRVIGELTIDDPLPFLDLEHPQTLAHLSDRLADELHTLGYDEPLDISDVCNRDRRLSREIALYAYAATDSAGEPVYSGIRYASRITSKWECWAIFDGNEVRELGRESVEKHNPALRTVAKMWGLTIH